MAHIVFANGSKQMAHNLDDSYERWQMRRSELAHERCAPLPADESIELFVPQLPTFADAGEIRAFRATLAEKQAYLQGRLAELNLKRQTSFYPDKDYHHDRAPLALAVTHLNYQMHQLTALANTTPGGTNERIRQLKVAEKDGSITPSDAIELVVTRAVVDENSLNGMLKKAARTENDDRAATLEHIVADQRKWLATTQAKLIAAYERIIELESSR